MLVKEIIQNAIRNSKYILGVAIFIVIIYFLQFVDADKPNKEILGNFKVCHQKIPLVFSSFFFHIQCNTGVLHAR